MPGVTFGLWLLLNHADHDHDAGRTVSTLPGNVCSTFNPVREAGVQVALSETSTPALNFIQCNLKRKFGTPRAA